MTLTTVALSGEGGPIGEEVAGIGERVTIRSCRKIRKR